jgi:hypothetical protein
MKSFVLSGFSLGPQVIDGMSGAEPQEGSANAFAIVMRPLLPTYIWCFRRGRRPAAGLFS